MFVSSKTDHSLRAHNEETNRSISTSHSHEELRSNKTERGDSNHAYTVVPQIIKTQTQDFYCCKAPIGTLSFNQMKEHLENTNSKINNAIFNTLFPLNESEATRQAFNQDPLLQNNQKELAIIVLSKFGIKVEGEIVSARDITTLRNHAWVKCSSPIELREADILQRLVKSLYLLGNTQLAENLHQFMINIYETVHPSFYLLLSSLPKITESKIDLSFKPEPDINFEFDGIKYIKTEKLDSKYKSDIKATALQETDHIKDINQGSALSLENKTPTDEYIKTCLKKWCNQDFLSRKEALTLYQYFHCPISSIQCKELTYKDYVYLLSNQYIDFEKIPYEHITDETSKIACKFWGENIIHVKRNLLTQEICNIACKNSALAIFQIPTKYITKELVKHLDFINIDILEKLPQELITDDVYAKACETSDDGITAIPREHEKYENFLNIYKKNKFMNLYP